MFVYGLKDPRSFHPRYVGITSKTLSRRLNNHLVDKEKTHKVNWIKKLTRDGLRPEIFVIEEWFGDYDSLKQREIYWIARLKSKGYRLVNGTLGGDGTVGRVVTKEQREHHSKSMRGRKFPDRKPMSQSSKDHLSKINKGINRMTEDNKMKLIESNKKDSGNWTDERRSKISDAMKGKPKSKEHIEKHRQAIIGKCVGSKNGNSRLTDVEVYDILNRYKNGEKLASIHNLYSHVTKQAVWYVIHKSKMR